MSSHILIIDDDQSLLELYRQILEPEGYTVTLSDSYSENLADIEAFHPDLIILDIKLSSGQNGFLLLEKLQLYPATKAIPVMICTAAVRSMEDQEETLREMGTSILYKPFDIDELLRLVQQSFLSVP